MGKAWALEPQQLSACLHSATHWLDGPEDALHFHPPKAQEWHCLLLR